jgi:hypothetical protein
MMILRSECAKAFFLRTQDISEKLVTYTLKNAKHDGNVAFSASDKRGKHTPHNKTSDDLLESTRSHINQFPTHAPHYTRADTNRRFLAADLNINKMHDLYKEQCINNKQPFVKAGVYHSVFCNEFNLSFHHPKKDLCVKCEQYNNASEEEKIQLHDEHVNHIKRNELARSEKAADKDRAMADKTWHAVTADLQSVLSTPCSNVSALYYARKLSIYNFTINNQTSHDGYCMLWNETIAHRGANEIGSLLYLYLRKFVTRSQTCSCHI